LPIIIDRSATAAGDTILAQDYTKRDDPQGSEIRDFRYRVPRFLTNFRFFVQVEPESLLREAVCRELAEDGLAAEISEPLPPGTLVTLLLTLPRHAATLRITARVTNQKGYVHGFAFISTSEEQRAFLGRYLSS
jgi:hypothetical protein